MNAFRWLETFLNATHNKEHIVCKKNCTFLYLFFSLQLCDVTVSVTLSGKTKQKTEPEEIFHCDFRRERAQECIHRNLVET